MERMKFDSDGNLVSVDGMDVRDKIGLSDGGKFGGAANYATYAEVEAITPIKTINLEEGFVWGLYHEGKNLEPLKFSNGKTQTDVAMEIIDAVKSGCKVIFLKGVCGTGKCLDKNTLVFCKPEKSSYFGYHKISALVGKEGDILSLDNFGNVIKSKFKNVRETGNKKLFKLKTNTGREIIASENHPFLTITREGVSWVSLDKLNEKSYICLPNKINIDNSKNYLEDGKLKILGHLISEGKLGDKSGSPKYYQDKTITPLIRQDYINSLKDIFPEGDIKDKHQTEVKINFYNMDTRFGTTNKLRLLVREFGLDGKKSKDKFVPDVIFNLPEEKIAIFLQALFSGDGSIYTRKSKNSEQMIVEYSSISKRLIQDVSILLSRLGIQHTIGFRKFRENLEYSRRITISNQENVKKYIEKIGFLGEKQGLALSILDRCKVHKFTNIDRVPRIIREYLKNKGHSYNELDRFLNYEKIEELRKNIGFKRIIKGKLTDTPCVFKQGNIDFLRSHLRKVNEYLNDNTLSFICNEQIFWDKIKSIEFFKEDVTYDLEVPEQNNFIADGIIVHNSAIALNVAKALGRASIVVPVKGLQKQYEEDYMSKKYLLKKSGEKIKIAMITGRDNHDSVFEPGKSCADPFLPDNISITEKNYSRIKEYYENNPFIKNKADVSLKMIKRISIAPANPYWSPIAPAEIELPLRDAKKKKYRGLRGREFVFYHRKEGCSYYDQYLAYLNADVIIFNSAKYKIEMTLDRKPETAVDIIDEADEFLDSFSNQQELNVSRLIKSLESIIPEGFDAQKDLDRIIEFLKGEEKNKQVLGIVEDKVYPLKETNMDKVLNILLKNKEICAEILIDEQNYAQKLLEAVWNFEGFFEDTYVNYQMRDGDVYANLVTVNLSRKFKDMMDKSNALVFMSGTMHSEEVLKHIFGIDNFKVVEAETSLQGNVEIIMTGKEIDCRYSNFSSKVHSRIDYLKAFDACMAKAKKPVLIHVNSYEDLPTEQEIKDNWIFGIMSREKLRELQTEDKTGRLISLFKAKMSNCLFTTKCSRGVDFPGDVCNSIVFTKYPNPNIRDPFWKILKSTHPDYFWEFYHDKARREFMQRIYRAIRSKDDHVYILSPDKRVLDAVKDLQNGRFG